MRLVYAPPVLLVTGGCCFLAIRWAVDQFNNESVLFRESERIDIRLRLRQLFRERGVTPTIAQAFACGLAILTVRFFASAAAKAPESWAEFSQLQFVTLAVFVAGPAILMAIFLTRNPRQPHCCSGRLRSVPLPWHSCWPWRFIRWRCWSLQVLCGCTRSILMWRRGRGIFGHHCVGTQRLGHPCAAGSDTGDL